MTKYDVIIVGAGPAGLTAALYLCRKNVNLAVFSVDVGGQVNLSSHIENYPGVEALPGIELKKRFLKSAENAGAKITMSKITKIDKKDKGFEVVLGDGTKHESRAILLCMGTVPRELGIPGEVKFTGRGVSTCATCDAPLFKKKTVVVIGGGNSAIEGALELADVGAEKVYLIHRRKEFRADAVSLEKLKANKKIENFQPYDAVEVVGDKFVSGIKIKNKETGEEKTLEVAGIFKEIGYVTDTNAFKDLLKLNERNEVIIDEKNNTSVPGVFAAGDLTTVPFKQIVISAGEGAKAALTCYQWLTGAKSNIDWKK